LMSTYFIVSDYQQQKARATQDAVAITRAVVSSLDRDLASVESGLHVLATSSTLDTGDLSAFYQQAKNALPFQNISNYVLIDPQGRQQINTLRPMGASLPIVGGPPALMRIFESGNTVLTNVFIGPASGKPTVAIGVPVQRQGKTIYSINAGISPERVAAVLKAQHLPHGWIGAVLDSQGIVVARTHEMERFAGHPAVPDLVRQAREKREGLLETVTLEGTPVITAFSRSSISNWSVAVGVPKSSLNAGLKQSLAELLIVNAVLSAAALWVAWTLALSKVVKPTDRLLERMRRMSRGEDPGPMPSTTASREFLSLDQGFSQMYERLQQHEQEHRDKVAAEAASQAKTNFLSRMSHELRTPLNAVLGFAQVLKMNTSDPLSTRQLAMVSQIESSGLHLLEMIADVLDVTKIENNAIDICLEDVDVQDVALECQQMLSTQAREAGVHLEVVMQGEVARVRADKTRLKQVLLNLLSNALKYNRPAGHVTLIARAEGPQLVFTVRDTGMGMNPEQALHLFEPFNRLGRENTNTPGTGIGLVICKRLVDLMGGTLTARSVENEGSEFTFALPFVGHAVPSTTADAPHHAVANPGGMAYGPRRVLYVEDNQANRDIMAAALDMRPQIELVIEASARAAMRRIEGESFHLLLLDMQLPDGNGMDILCWLQQDPRRRDLPVIIVSADVTAETIARADRAGARTYLSKPLDLAYALDMIDSLLQVDSAVRQPSSRKL
jgi:two-component system sensor histidine kinase/response regulator